MSVPGSIAPSGRTQRSKSRPLAVLRDAKDDALETLTSAIHDTCNENDPDQVFYHLTKIKRTYQAFLDQANELFHRLKATGGNDEASQVFFRR